METTSITPVPKKRGRPKGSKNKKVLNSDGIKIKKSTELKSLGKSEPVAIVPVIADEYNDVIYMPMDSVLEKFGDMQYIAVSASWVKDHLISSFIKETKSLKENPKDVAEKELNTPTKVLDNEEDNPKVEFNLTEF